MKILGISGGTKDGANDSMCKEALMGAKEAGAEVEFIRLLDLDIKPCTGCIACVKSLFSGKGNHCVLKDDLEWLDEQIRKADGVVYAMPIFEGCAPGIFHNVMDRCGPRTDRAHCMIMGQIAQQSGHPEVFDPSFIRNKCISFMGIGGSEWADCIQNDFNMYALTRAWKVVQNQCFSWSKHIFIEDEKIALAHEIGANLAKATQEMLDYKGDPMAWLQGDYWKGPATVCPHCHNNSFYFVPGTATARCMCCGIEGEIKLEGGAVKFEFDHEKWLGEHGLAHDTIPGKFKHADDIKTMEDKLAEIKKTNPKYKENVDKYKAFIKATKP